MTTDPLASSGQARRRTTAQAIPMSIGVDVGGTKIAAGVVDLNSGAIMHRCELSTAPERGGDAVLADVVALASELRAASGVDQCGVGVPELVDRTGNVTSDFTLPWTGIDVQREVERRAGLVRCVVQADVRAHALAEARFGAGRGFDPFVFVSIGTGISSCLVLGGAPFAGARGNALVLATGPVTVFDANDVPVSFVLEEYASGAALARRFGVARVEAIVAAAATGDARATRALRDGGAAVGAAIGWLASVLDPAAVVVGGGLGAAPGLYWDALVDAVRAHIWSEATRALPVLHAALGNSAGVVGAALAAAH